jgi:hypothetical protein
MHIRLLFVLVLLVLIIHYSPSIAADKVTHKKAVSSLRDISKDSIFVGIVKDLKDAGDANNAFGILGVADSATDVSDFFFTKVNSSINYKIIGKKVKILWSLQVDTTLDESNSFSQIDSILVLNQ